MSMILPDTESPQAAPLEPSFECLSPIKSRSKLEELEKSMNLFQCDLTPIGEFTICLFVSPPILTVTESSVSLPIMLRIYIFVLHDLFNPQ